MPEESTTPDLVELTRRAFQPTVSRDIDGIMSFYRPDAVWISRRGGWGCFRAARRLGSSWKTGFALTTGSRLTSKRWCSSAAASRSWCPFRRAVWLAAAPRSSSATPPSSCGRNGLIESVTNYTDIKEARAAAERLAQERE